MSHNRLAIQIPDYDTKKRHLYLNFLVLWVAGETYARPR